MEENDIGDIFQKETDKDNLNRSTGMGNAKREMKSSFKELDDFDYSILHNCGGSSSESNNISFNNTDMNGSFNSLNTLNSNNNVPLFKADGVLLEPIQKENEQNSFLEDIYSDMKGGEIIATNMVVRDFSALENDKSREQSFVDIIDYQCDNKQNPIIDEQ